MALPFLDTCSGPGIDPFWDTTLGADSFRQDAGIYKGDNQGAGFYTGSRQATLVAEVAGSIGADVGVMSLVPLNPASLPNFDGTPFTGPILASSSQWWSQGISTLLLGNSNPAFTEVEIRFMIYSNTNGVLYTELLLSDVQPNGSWDFRSERVGLEYRFYKNDILIYTATMEDTSDSMDPTVALGCGGTTDFFGTLDNIEVLAFAPPPPSGDVLGEAKTFGAPSASASGSCTPNYVTMPSLTEVPQRSDSLEAVC